MLAESGVGDVGERIRRASADRAGPAPDRDVSGAGHV